MASDYERTLARAKAVLSEEVRKALGQSGLVLLYDAAMIMAFADGEVDDDETRFLNDFAKFLGCATTNDDLTPETLLTKLAALDAMPLAAEAFVKVILVVTGLDDDISEDEMALWRDIGKALGVSNARMNAIRQLINKPKPR